jgi:uncharacterized protein YggE
MSLPVYSRLILLCGSYLFLYTTTDAQVMGNYAEQQQSYSNVVVDQQFRALPRPAEFSAENVLEFNINALSNQEADSYVAYFSLIQIGQTADETNRLMNQRIEAFQRDLRALGIPAEDVYIDLVNFLPKYAFDVEKKVFSKKTYTEIPVGFELQKNLHLRYRNPSQLEQIVTAAARQEIYDIIKVDYVIDEPRTVYAELREAAFAYLETVRERYAAAGLPVDSAYQQVAENAWVAYPINRYESYRAYSTQQLSQSERSSATVERADKPVSRFYNAVPPSDYDIVLNPEILEPAVQFSYNLKVRFFLPERTPRTVVREQTKYLLLTPEGELRTLKVE